jgi:tetratricopeptide (TPR) repeat protein
MKKTLFILSFLLITWAGFSQSKYQSGMQKAFELWGADKPWEAANLFERIAQAEPDNWLPPFYVAQINVLYSFSEKDKEKLTAQLNKARDFINKAKALSPDNPEIIVLDAQWYTAWIVFDGQQYGMKYSQKTTQLYQKAKEIAPDNPRVVLGNAEWAIGSARFFGQPIDQFCGELERAVELFATFKPEGEFHPRGGGDHAREVLEANCKS